MYQFNIAADESGAWRFELNGINLLLDGFVIKDDKHWIENPTKAMAFFNINGHLYGISNELITYKTAEDFFDTMSNQYTIFRQGLNKAPDRALSLPTLSHSTIQGAA